MKRLIGIALSPLVALTLAGCGPVQSKPEVATAGGKPKTNTAKHESLTDKQRKFAQCMRKNGVNMPDPKPGKTGAEALASGGDNSDAPSGGLAKVGDKTGQKAFEKCRDLAPSPEDMPKPKPEDLKKLRAASKCMRDHGVTNYPDPDANGTVKISTDTLDLMNPAFQKAQKACESLMGNLSGLSVNPR